MIPVKSISKTFLAPTWRGRDLYNAPCPYGHSMDICTDVRVDMGQGS